MEHAWHHRDISDVLTKLKSSHSGITSTEAARRLLAYGKNIIPHRRRDGAARIILRQCANTLTVILLAASGVSFLLHDTLDGYVILAAVVVNVLVGSMQEAKASRALDKLRSVMTFEALVLRDGEELRVPSACVVMGDILLLKAGGRIPADARVITANRLELNEAALTGESFPVPKIVEPLQDGTPLAERRNMVFAGTTIVQGEGRAVVVAVGEQTEYGRIAQSLKTTTAAETPLQVRLAVLSRRIGVVLLTVTLAMFFLGIALGVPITQMLPVSVAVAVAAIPEGLPVAITVILAVGMQRILARRALVRRLVAAETLGSTTVICTDKTGTLTEGEMSVVHILTEQHDVLYNASSRGIFGKRADASSALRMLEIGMLCNDAIVENEEKPLEHRVVIGNPTDRALIHAGHAAGLDRSVLAERSPRIDAVPFASEYKYMATLHRTDHGGRVLFLKGAVEAILAWCDTLDHEGATKPLTAEKKAALIATAERLSNQGLRVLAFAMRHVPSDVQQPFRNDPSSPAATFLGMVGMKDPLRASAHDAIGLCRSAGIRIVMITGDHPLTARTIAQELGLPVHEKNIMTGPELALLEDYELERRVRDVDVYARVVPQDKLRIVKALQATGAVVAMTGDGVNDAPALKAAAIGIALGSGTDVAKETADLVLLDNNFSTIVESVRQGRVIFDNIRKVLLYLMAGSLAEVFIIAAGLVYGFFQPGFPLPLLAAQILWVNIVTDILPNIALAFDPAEPGIMHMTPRDPSEPLLTRFHWALMAVVSLSTGLVSFGFFWYFWKTTGNVDLARSVAFMSHAAFSLTYIFSLRALRHSIFRARFFSNRSLLLAVGGAFGIQLIALYVAPLQSILRVQALSAGAWVAIAGGVVCILLIIECIKAVWILPKQRRA